MKIKIEVAGLTLEHATELTKFLSSLASKEITADLVSAELEDKEVTQIKQKLTRKKAEKVEAPKQESESPQEKEFEMEKAEAIEVVEPETVSAPTLMQIRSLVAQKAGEHKDSIKAKLVELGAQNVSTLDPKHFQAIFTFLTEL